MDASARLRRGSGSTVRRRVIALVIGAAVLATSAPVQAQAPSPPAAIDLCVVTPDELNGRTGLAFERLAQGPANCAYEGGPDDAPYLLDLSTEDPGNGFIVFETPGDRMIGYQFRLEDAVETSVGGRLAWLGTNGLAVDMGGQVLLLTPILVFATDPPDPLAFLPPVAELAVGRLPEVIPAVQATPFPMGDE
jgi:hypothetical protein